MNFILDPSLVLYLPLHKLDGASFMSRDAYGHLCTVTGALWRHNGRYFDGDDFIQLGQDLFETDSSGTVIIWVKRDASDNYDRIFSSSDVDGSDFISFHTRTTDNIAIHHYNAVGNAHSDHIRGDTSLGTGWRMLTWISSSSAWSMYVDGAVETLTVLAGSNTGDWFADFEAVVHDVRVGRLQFSGGGGYTTGYVGEVLVYNRALTPLEIQNNYLATKWRYQ